ncbi:MAG TPA: PEP-CTERM sorting domain-containing protein [Acidobacteriaceae bacterium]|nr:PEP-CTERM sorting domain-containing protein [Acidobacteriaceae bacterium]
MKLLLAILALISFGAFVPNMYADPTLTLNAQAGVGTFTETVAANVYTWTYVDDATNGGFLPGILPIPWATTDNNVFTAIFTYVPLGVSVLNVTDICANAALNAPVTPCNLDFSFSDTAVGAGYMDASNTPALLGTLDIGLGADVDLKVLDGITSAGLDIGGGQAQIDFPPPAAATPEPSTLGLMGTSLLGIAGVVRRKFRG